MLKKSIFMLISWLLLLSMVSCAQVEPVVVAQNTLPADQTVNTKPIIDEATDEVELMPTPINPKTELVSNSGETATSTTMPEPTAITASTATPSTSTLNNEEEKPMTAQPPNQGTEKLVMQAKEDLAQRLNVTPEEIEVVEVQAVTWGDTSMGCPQPDMRYKQVPQDGLLIKLKVEEQVYEYHSGGSREPFLCEQTIRVKPTIPKLDEFVPSPGADK